MWELTLSINQDKKEVLDYLFVKLEPQIKFNKGIIIKYQENRRNKVSLAVPKKQKEYFLLFILELVSDVIATSYKSEYIENNITQVFADPLKQTAFVSALTAFDKQTDIDLIKKQLILTGELNIDGFYYFKLALLRDRWEDVCRLVSENQMNLKIKGASNELIKFLVKSSQTSAIEMHVYKNDRVFYLTDATSIPIKTMNNNISSESLLIKTIINFCPARIVIHGDILDEKTQSLINQLFEERLSLCGSEATINR